MTLVLDKVQWQFCADWESVNNLEGISPLCFRERVQFTVHISYMVKNTFCLPAFDFRRIFSSWACLLLLLECFQFCRMNPHHSCILSACVTNSAIFFTLVQQWNQRNLIYGTVLHKKMHLTLIKLLVLWR